MARGTPESIESRYQRVRRLTDYHDGRRLLFMVTTGIGIVGTFLSAAYVSEKYYPITNTLEEIQQGQIDSYTQTALWASLGVLGFELFSVLSVLAVGYHTYRCFRYERETNRLLKEMERQSKRPPTLGS